MHFRLDGLDEPLRLTIRGEDNILSICIGRVPLQVGYANGDGSSTKVIVIEEYSVDLERSPVDIRAIDNFVCEIDSGFRSGAGFDGFGDILADLRRVHSAIEKRGGGNGYDGQGNEYEKHCDASPNDAGCAIIGGTDALPCCCDGDMFHHEVGS